MEFSSSVVLNLLVEFAQAGLGQRVLWLKHSFTADKAGTVAPPSHLDCLDVLRRVEVKYLASYLELRQFLLNAHLLLSRSGDGGKQGAIVVVVVDDVERFCEGELAKFAELSGIAREMATSLKLGLLVFSLAIPQPLESTARLSAYFNLRMELDEKRGALRTVPHSPNHPCLRRIVFKLKSSDSGLSLVLEENNNEEVK
ncbi:hypothetical protein BASA81_003538 [Batrachochytrium salamandrivorans]|nr:hypothetical protein BASA81_003538 [Batrachochytrium salamandrivorans]